jgi:hypothetical protein
MRDGNNQRLEGTATKLKGKVTTIKLRGGKAPSGNLRTVKVVGLPEPTNSEKVRDELVCLVLAGQKQLRQSSFIRRLWFPRDRQTRTLDASQPASVTSSMRLNDSQSTAMRAMVGNSPIVIVHGTSNPNFILIPLSISRRPTRYGQNHDNHRRRPVLGFA